MFRVFPTHIGTYRISGIFCVGKFWRKCRLEGVLNFHWVLFSLFQGLSMKTHSRVYFSLCLFLAVTGRSRTQRKLNPREKFPIYGIRIVIITVVRSEEIFLIYSTFAISHSNRKDHKRIRLITQRVHSDRQGFQFIMIHLVCWNLFRSPIVKIPESPSYNLNHRLVTINGFGKICTKAVEPCNIHMNSEVQSFCYKIVLGIEFYLFVSHGGMKDRVHV